MAGPDLIYKVADRAHFEAARSSGTFHGAPVDLADGFIHFSTAAQLPDTLRLHFARQGDLVLFAVPVATLADLRWERSRGGQLFPHLYGPLDMSVVADSGAISVGADGTVTLPDWVR
jgi:uncharacterized protein (DUF952 family)